jgi:hypothetical protein
MDSKLLFGLIKEVVKNEVKQQVKEELAKLIKSGVVTLNSQKKPSTPSLREITEVAPTTIRKQQPIQQQRPQQTKKYTKNRVLNEVLNMTQPFTAAQRTEGEIIDKSSILNIIQPEKYEEDGWETIDYTMQQTPQQIPSTGNSGLDALQKALDRDYTQLTKVFIKQEKEKGLK